MAIKRLSIIDKIDSNTLSNTFDVLRNLKENDKLEIVIDSSGGDLSITKKIINSLLDITNPITTIATNKCMSAATLIFLIGQKRIVLEETKFIIHRPEFIPRSDQRLIVPVISQILKELRKDESFMKRFYITHNVPSHFINTAFSEDVDYILSVEQLLEYNMATAVGQYTLKYSK